ncbi:hypothetical protein NKH86_29915 [Mesorhizobium sp. M0913]|uniref:hypothetical protein n=1 Tax=Mesorhizobium sp. M0913 TaxID=2957026 RepID=UPI00333E0C83
MASHGVRPTIDLQAGTQVLDQHLPRVLSFRGQTIEELGWSRPSDRTLLVPMRGTFGGNTEEYLLRLDFLAGSDWPPSARFVNPATLDYAGLAEQHHLPQLTSPEVHVHPAYQNPSGQKIQLVCCSAVFEYYDVNHGGEDTTLWRTGDTFNHTLAAIERAFRNHYSGRFDRHAG